MTPEIDKFMKQIIGEKHPYLEDILVHSGFKKMYTVDGYVSYESENSKLLYDRVSQTIVGYIDKKSGDIFR